MTAVSYAGRTGHVQVADLGELITDFTTVRTVLPRAGWGQSEAIEMFLRVSPITLTRGVVGQALQIVKVKVNLNARLRGLFSRWITEIEDAVLRSPVVDYVYVENVLNPHLARSLERRGYSKVLMCSGSGKLPDVYSYFKRVEVNDVQLA